jgi:two-component system, NarL family, nitrate/nitrite response regulator NarL
VNRRESANTDGPDLVARAVIERRATLLKPIRIGIFDDHTLMREALGKALSSVGAFDLIASGGSADDAVASCTGLLPDIAILDMQMPGGGLDAVRRLFRDVPVVKSVILSSDDSEHSISAAYAAGAFGFLTKGQPLVNVIADLKAIAAGQSQFSSGLARSLVSLPGLAAPWRDEPKLWDLAITPREEQILSRSAQGLSVAEIASSIGVSQQTVACTFTNILQKLHEHALLTRALASLDGNGG